MTIAERIRVQKVSRTDFDAVKFMEFVTYWFENTPYDSQLSIDSTAYELRKSYDTERYWLTSVIDVPSCHYKTAIDMVLKEGFYVYRLDDTRHIVSLKNEPSLKLSRYTSVYQIKSVNPD